MGQSGRSGFRSTALWQYRPSANQKFEINSTHSRARVLENCYPKFRSARTSDRGFRASFFGLPAGGRGSVVERSIMACQLRTACQPFCCSTTSRVIWANKNFFCCLLLSRTVQLTACPVCCTVLKRLSIDHLDDERCVRRFRVAKLTKCMRDTGGQTDSVSHVRRQDTSEQLVAGSQCRSSLTGLSTAKS